MMEIFFKKRWEKTSVKVNQPIWKNCLQRISRNLPPKQQFKLPIFKHWRLKINSSYLNFSAQSGRWYRMHNVYHHITMETIHHRTFRVNWTLDKSKGCHIESVFLWTNLAFQSKHFISNWIPGLQILPDSKNNLYDRKWPVPQI